MQTPPEPFQVELDFKAEAQENALLPVPPTATQEPKCVVRVENSVLQVLVSSWAVQAWYDLPLTVEQRRQLRDAMAQDYRPGGTVFPPDSCQPPDPVPPPMTEEQVEEHFNQELPPPDWDRFRGNNHERLPTPPYYNCGRVDLFRYHGERYYCCDDLWEDIICRLGAETLRIYGRNDCEWTDMGADVNIYVDPEDMIESITLAPTWRHRHPVDMKNARFYQKTGPAIGHTAGLDKVDFS